jgi:putative endonuclease
MPRPCAVYILTNPRRTVLYVGVTSNLTRRLEQHRCGLGSRFTRRYHADQLVYVECFEGPRAAIAREKQLKAGSRRKKVELIERNNPDWVDLTPSLRGGP